MRNLLFVMVAVLGLVGSAKAAQFSEFPDVNGQFTLKCQADEFANHKPYNVNTGTFEIAFVRVDLTPPVEFARGAIDLNTGYLVFVGPVQATPGDDAEIVCVAYDKSGNKSDRSVDSAVVDFTSPAKPVIKSN
jgi:hypothetical protein